MAIKEISPNNPLVNFYHFYPCNVTLVGARRGDQVNFMAAAWNTGLSFDPPLIGVSISPKRFTHDMIVESKEFTYNFLPLEEIATIHGTGRISGRDHDKVDLFSIELESSNVIRCPTIKAAYAAYECRLVHQYPVGDHNFFVGEVMAVHYHPDAILSNGQLNPDKLNFSLYLGSNTYISTNPNSKKVMPTDIEI